ncbi:hypothetical protein D3C71_1866490 [compost metagenome]
MDFPGLKPEYSELPEVFGIVRQQLADVLMLVAQVLRQHTGIYTRFTLDGVQRQCGRICAGRRGRALARVAALLFGRRHGLAPRLA